jgi:hypothetical protein
VLTQELIDNKLKPALAALDEIDPKQEMEIEAKHALILAIFCLVCLVPLILLVALVIVPVVLDWKFGDGVMLLRWKRTRN